MARDLDVAKVADEFEAVSLGDARLDERLLRIASLLAASPSASFPDAMDSEADQEALYRFLSNPKVTMAKVLAGHREATVERMAGRSLVRILHDTSQFCFRGEREGLGILRGNAKGFFAHVALAVGGDDVREPLGVLGVRPYINVDVESRRGLSQAKKNSIAMRKPRAEKKASRWEEHAIEIAKMLPPQLKAVHVMDQEADDFAVFAALDKEKIEFVIRAEPRRLTADGISIADRLKTSASETFRTVSVSARSKQQATRSHPIRAERIATLQVRSSKVTLQRTATEFNEGGEIALYAVHVFEPAPPDDDAPIDWMLLTNQAVSSSDDMMQIVDHYRARWIVEEFFKALKTGCAIETRQLCSLEALLRAFALFVPMAWQLLRLRHLARADEKRPALRLMTREQLLLLRVLLEKRKRRFPKSPTARDAMLGIAALGGHIKNNGDPGWMVLGRGFRRFADAEEVWQAMRECDQS
jgi:hypothetical protein